MVWVWVVQVYGTDCGGAFMPPQNGNDWAPTPQDQVKAGFSSSGVLLQRSYYS